MELQTAFYIIGIIFMSLMLLIILAVLAAVLVIRTKVVNLEKQISEKLNTINHVFSAGEKMAATVAKTVKKVAKH